MEIYPQYLMKMSLLTRKDISSIRKGKKIFSKCEMWYKIFSPRACFFPLTTNNTVLRSLGMCSKMYDNENKKSHPAIFPMKIYP